jgi:hypothetical protein
MDYRQETTLCLHFLCILLRTHKQINRHFTKVSHVRKYCSIFFGSTTHEISHLEAGAENHFEISAYERLFRVKSTVA